MAVRGQTFVAALLVALSPLACNLSADADDGGQVSIAEFRIERAEPPGSVAAGRLSVVPRARLTLALAVDGPVERLVLSAGERVLAELSPDATVYVDDCDVAPCGTAETGEVVYTLAAIGSGEDPATAARSLAVQVTEPEAP